MNIKTGDIICASWGYEQTNIDFYEVIATTAKTVKLRQVDTNRTYNSETMTGFAEPVRGKFIGEPFSRKVTDFGYIKIGHGYGQPWDGKPARFSCYA